jgi:osmotically-inducible protein OsmY
MMTTHTFTSAIFRCTFLPALLLAISSLATPPGPPPGETKPAAAHATPALADSKITFTIEGRFAADDSVPWDAVDVQTKDGIVTLSGTVQTPLAHDRAELIALTVAGVRSVVNTLAVVPPPRSDDAIRTDVLAALKDDAATAGSAISAQVKDAEVTLTGTVGSFREKQDAKRVAEGEKGVCAVFERLEVKLAPNSIRSDDQIAKDVREALDNDAWIDARFVKADVQAGGVTLSGEVGSAAAKSRAEAVAWVGGVHGVNATALHVGQWLNDPMRKAPRHQALPDSKIRNAVIDALARDPRVWAFNPRVEVEGALVTLSGTVETLQALAAAEETARNTTGVWDVRNLLKVRPANPPADQVLIERARQALSRDPFIPANRIDVTARAGVITLLGRVDTEFEKSHARQIVSRLRDVVRVQNRLDVRDATQRYTQLPWAPGFFYDPEFRPVLQASIKTDAQIKDAIEDRLRTDPFLAGADLGVKVEHGTATLYGEVASWPYYNIATNEAFAAGARNVHNIIAVADAPAIKPTTSSAGNISNPAAESGK